MSAVFRRAFGALRGQALAWGVSFALLAIYAVWAFDAIFSQSSQLTDIYNQMPPELMAFFGDVNNLTDPGTFLSFALFSYGVVVLGIYAVVLGSGLIVADEESGRLDLLQAYPVSRSALFFGRAAAMLAAIALVLGIGWAGCLALVPHSHLDVGAGALLLPFVATFGQLALFAALALLLSLALSSRRQGASVAGFLLVASYFVTSLAKVNDQLAGVARFSPLHYFQSGDAIHGLDLQSFGALLTVAVLFGLVAWRLYQGRDLRVSGEGGWQWNPRRVGRLLRR